MSASAAGARRRQAAAPQNIQSREFATLARSMPNQGARATAFAAAVVRCTPLCRRAPARAGLVLPPARHSASSESLRHAAPLRFQDPRAAKHVPPDTHRPAPYTRRGAESARSLRKLSVSLRLVKERAGSRTCGFPTHRLEVCARQRVTARGCGLGRARHALREPFKRRRSTPAKASLRAPGCVASSVVARPRCWEYPTCGRVVSVFSL